MGRLSSLRAPLSFLADKSAWERSGHPSIAAAWVEAAADRRLLTCSVVRYELLYSTQDLSRFYALAEQLAAYRDLPITAATHRAAHAAMRELAAAGPLHHRVPLSDLLIAAAAQEAGVPVVHCDAHFDRIATVLAVESRWLVDPAPPGG